MDGRGGTERAGSVVGVLGGSGGIGASTFAAVLAALSAPAVLLDLDAAGGGIDVLLGVERAPGARWSGLRLAGGRLDPSTLLDGLPSWGGGRVLAADTATLEAEAVLQVVSAATAAGPVVVDLPRAATPERAAALVSCDLVVVLARGDVAGIVGAHAVRSALPELPVGLVVRRAGVVAVQAAEAIGAPLLGELPPVGPAGLRLDPGRLPRTLARVAAGVLAGLPVPVRAGVPA